MKVLYSPQLGLGVNIKYRFQGNNITVTYKGIVDEFDFSNFPDGELDISSVETILEVQPIVSAKKVGGVLQVELLNFIGTDATEEERFPQWFDSEGA